MREVLVKIRDILVIIYWTISATNRKIHWFFIRNWRRIKRFFIRSYRKGKRFFVKKRRNRNLKKKYKHNQKLETKKEIYSFGKRIKDFWENICSSSVSKKVSEIELRDSQCRQNYLEGLQEIIDKMPESNGSRYYKKQKNRISIVADEFLFDAYKDSAELIYITPSDYEDYIDKVDFLLVVSAWRGLHNEWRLMGTEGKENNIIIHNVIQKYKESGKKVVFYSKEDPPNYEHFLPIAKKCDYIFTTCIEKIDDYKRDCENDNVYPLEFCINPVFHNPVGMKNDNKKDGVLFAGSWMKKYPERLISTEIMLDGVIKMGKELIIADRNFSMNNLTYFFPRKYYQYITKEIPHDSLQKVHKLYDWAININSITDSKTMFANRVYELQANGCLMISNYSKGVSEKFDEVNIVESIDDVVDAMSKYSEDETYRHQINGIRRVMTGETCYDRMPYFLKTIGEPYEDVFRTVLVVVDKLNDTVIKQFELQTYAYKEIITADEISQDKMNDFDIIAVWCSKYNYGMYYLEDMINGFKYTNCDYITKDAVIKDGNIIKGIEHDYVSKIKNVYATVFWRDCISLNEILNIKEISDRQNGYSIDHFNFECF